MIPQELQAVFDLEQHLSSQSYLSEEQQALLNRMRRYLRKCMREITISDGKKVKE